MNEELLQIMRERLPRIPGTIKSILVSSGWVSLSEQLANEIALTKEQSVDLQLEIAFVLLGLVHPDDFRNKIEDVLRLSKEEVDLIVTKVGSKVFAPIQHTLVEFFEKEASENPDDIIIPEKTPMQMPDIAPENLPTDEEGESLLTSFTPSSEGEETMEPLAHPFEEKMRKVFTAGQQSLGDLAIEPRLPGAPAPTSVVPLVPHVPNVPPTPPIYQADPYREAIE